MSGHDQITTHPRRGRRRPGARRVRRLQTTAAAARQRRHGQDKAFDGALKFAKCMREHGIDMPDPKRVRQRAASSSPAARANSNDPKMKAAQSACQKYMRDRRRRDDRPAKRAKLQDAALKYARCMRGQGVNMPDPKLGRQRRPHLPGRPRPARATAAAARQGLGVSPDSPEFKAADKACNHLLGDRRGGPGASTEADRDERRRAPAGAGAVAPPRRPRRSLAAAAVARRGRGRRLAAARARRRPARQRRQRRASPLGAAAVERRDLVDRAGHRRHARLRRPRRKAPPRPPAPITRLRAEGDTVTRGRSLMSIDAKATAWVLYGTMPDVPRPRPGRRRRPRRPPARAQPRRRSATTPAPSTTTGPRRRPPRRERLPGGRDLTESGDVARGEVVFSDGPARVGKHSAEVGEPARSRRAGDRR